MSNHVATGVEHDDPPTPLSPSLNKGVEVNTSPSEGNHVELDHSFTLPHLALNQSGEISTITSVSVAATVTGLEESLTPSPTAVNKGDEGDTSPNASKHASAVGDLVELDDSLTTPHPAIYKSAEATTNPSVSNYVATVVAPVDFPTLSSPALNKGAEGCACPSINSVDTARVQESYKQIHTTPCINKFPNTTNSQQEQ